MKRLVIKLVDMKQVESVEEHEDGAGTTVRKVWEEREVIVEANHDISEHISNNSAWNVIKNLAGKMVELEILKRRDTIDEVSESDQSITQSEVEDIFNDMIEDCYIDLHDFNAGISRH